MFYYVEVFFKITTYFKIRIFAFLCLDSEQELLMYYSVNYSLFFNPRILKSLSKCRNIVRKEGSSSKSEGRWESEGTY